MYEYRKTSRLSVLVAEGKPGLECTASVTNLIGLRCSCSHRVIVVQTVDSVSSLECLSYARPKLSEFQPKLNEFASELSEHPPQYQTVLFLKSNSLSQVKDKGLIIHQLCLQMLGSHSSAWQDTLHEHTLHLSSLSPSSLTAEGR